MTGIDCRTYKGGTGAGGRVTLARKASVLALSAQGTSVFWVHPNGLGDSPTGSGPTATPDPSANSDATGWLRVAGAESPPSAGANSILLPLNEQVISLDIWCETAGYLVILASEGLPALARQT